MGLSSNQARFLSLTSRQIDMEQRIQQICQRRLRLSSELENVATSYNNSISNRKMFTASQTNSGIKSLSVDNLAALGYKVVNNKSNQILKAQQTTTPAGFTSINTQADFMNLVTTLNGGSGLNGKYILNCDIDLSGNTYTQSLINNTFTGTFDGNGHTVNNLNINTSGAAIDGIGMFSKNTGTIENVLVNNANINATNSGAVGAIVGDNSGGTVTNVSASGAIIANGGVGGVVGTNQLGGVVSYASSSVDITGASGSVGGLVGSNNSATISNSCATGNVTTSSAQGVGGLSGSNYFSGVIDQCYATGNVNAGSGSVDVGGLVGDMYGVSVVAKISNSYSTGTVTAPNSVGGVVGATGGTGGPFEVITNSYTTSQVNGSTYAGGFLGRQDGGGSIDGSNFYQNNLPASPGGAVTNPAAATASWSSTIWDKSTTLPTLNNVGYKAFAEDIEKNLRNGTYSLAKDADEFTQETLSIDGKKYEEVDWRTVPEVYDELYGGDDVDAENKYDKTIEEINAQDKKLQLEQTSVETEYKAVSSEREAVKKILDTNATSSFKYFS